MANVEDWEMGQRDIRMLRRLATTSPKTVAKQFFPKSDNPVKALDQWILRMRKRRERYQWYLNSVLAISKKSNYVKKRLIYVSMPFLDDDDDLDES